MEFTQTIMQDVRFAARGMRRYPGFATAVVLTLCLGIGANAAIFTVVDATMLRPLPFPEADRLVEVRRVLEGGFAIPDLDIDDTEVVRSIAPFLLAGGTPRSAARTDVDPPAAITLYAVEPSIFNVLQIRPILGRPFEDTDVSSPTAPVIILNNSYWRAQFGATSDVLGATIRVDGTVFTIIGVLPAEIRYPFYGDFIGWIPARSNGVLPGMTQPLRDMTLVGRLPSGQSAEVGDGILDQRLSALHDEGGATDILGLNLHLLSSARQNSDVRRSLWVLMGAVTLMWLIAVINGTNLFMVRNSARNMEMAVRLSLGASRWRIVRQILTEAILLALLAGGLGVMVTGFAIASLGQVLPSEVVSFSAHDVTVSFRVYVYVFAASVVTGLFFGLVPAVRAVIDAGGAGGPARTRRLAAQGKSNAFRNGLVVLQIAIAVVLLVGAGLLMRSFSLLNHVKTGFDANGVTVMTVSLAQGRYDTGEKRAAFREAALRGIRALPGVIAATQGTATPGHAGFSFGIDSVGIEDGTWLTVPGNAWFSGGGIDEEFFDTVGIQLLSGRNFRSTDLGRNDIVILDEDLATLLFVGGNPLNRQVRFDSDGPWRTVVGVAANTLLLSPAGSPQAFGLDEQQSSYERYFPNSAAPRSVYMSFAVRSSAGGPTGNDLRTVVRTLDPLQAVAEVSQLATSYAETIAKPRFNSLLMTLLAVVATVLTIVGVYGVLSFSIAQRTKELGIRIALGAQSTQLRGMVVMYGMRMAVVGVIGGLAVAIPFARTMRSLLFQTSATDAPTLAVVSVLMLITAGCAAYFPSRRAITVDPARVLRMD